MDKLRCLAFSALTASAFCFSPIAICKELKFGAQVGGFGTTRASSIGYGVLFGLDPYGWIGFQADGALAEVNASWYSYVSPAIVFYPVNFEEFQLGIIGGGGFYKISGVSTRFGLNGGVTGDFNLSDSFAVGMQTRYHGVFDSVDLWSVFFTGTYRHDLGGGW